MMLSHNGFLTILAAAAFLTAKPALAFSLSPMSVSLEPQGRNASHSFVVDNNGPEKIAVQISMTHRQVAIDGKELNPEADDDFILYPPQLTLGPNEKRTVRVTWSGSPTPPKELAYRIIAEQLPVDTARPEKKGNAVIKMLLRYMGAVYVTPKGASPKIEVTKIERTDSGKTGPRLLIEIENKGTAHQIIKAAKLRLSSGQSSVELSGDEIKALIGENLLAGGVRRYEIPWPSKLQNGALKAELEIKD